MKSILKKYGLVILTVFFLLAFQIVGLPNSNDSVTADKKAGLFGFNLFNELNFFSFSESDTDPLTDPENQEEPTTEEDETTSNEDETSPEEGETTPEEGQTTPEEGETTPEEDETIPEEEDTTPEEGETTPEEGDTTPEEGETTPEEEDTTPEEGGTTPEEGDTTPEEGETTPEEEDTTPEEEVVPEDEGETAPEEDAEIVCICDVLCSVDLPNMDCPVCSLVEDGDYSSCCKAPEVEEEVTPEVEEPDETPETPEVEEEVSPEEVTPEVEPETPEEPILSSGVTYNGKYYDGTTIAIKDEETLSIDIEIPARNEGGTLLVDVPEGLALVGVTLSTSQDGSSTSEDAQTDTKSSTMAMLDVGTKNGVNSFTVEAGVRNSFVISVKIDPDIIFSENMEVWGARVIDITYNDLTGTKVGNTSVKVNTVEYLQYVSDSQTPSTITDPILSISTSYSNVWYNTSTEKITVANTDYIRIKASLASGNNGGTLSFDIPKGFELVNAPGVSGLSSNGATVSEKDILLSEATYLNTFDGGKYYSWVQDDIPNKWSTIYNKNGVLTYKLNGGNISDISVYVKIDSNYINYYYGDLNASDKIEQAFGQIKVNYDGDTNDEIYTPTVNVVSSTYNMTFSSMSAIETLDDFYSTTTTADSKLTYGLSDTVNVSTSLSIDNAFIGSKTFSAKNLVLTLRVPNGTKITKNTGTLTPVSTNKQNYTGFTQPSSGDGINDGAYYDTYTITITSPSFSLSSGKYTCTLNNFLTVQFPSDTFTLGTDGASVSHYIYVDNFIVDLLEFDWDNTSYTTATTEIGTNTEFVYAEDVTTNMDVRRATVTIEDLEADVDNYSIRWDSYLNNNEVHNPNDGKDQLLYKVRRYFKDGYLSSIVLPIIIEYNQDKVATDGNDAAYLDNVNKVVMSTPLLGDIDRYGAKLSKIYVAYDDGTSETLTNFSGWNGNATDGYHPTLNYSSSTGKFTGSNFSVTYNCNTIANSNPVYSNFVFDALNGKSIVNIKAYFFGDNETYTDGMNYVYGTPKFDSTTEYSDHWFRVMSFEEDDRTFVDNYSGISTSNAYGFKWKDTVDFVLTRTALWSTDLASKYSPFNYFTFNTAIYNMKLQIANWSHNPRGYLDMGAIRYNNYTGSDAESVTLEIIPNSYAALGSNQVDVIKEIMFPYNNYSNMSQITSVEYKYNEDANVYVYNRDFHGTSNAPFYVEQRNISGETTVYYAQKSAFMTAPADKSFEYVIVSYDSWGVTSENRYVMFKGYPNVDSVVEGTNSTGTIHTVNVTYDGTTTTNTQKEDRSGRKFTDISSSGSGIGVDVLNTTTGVFPGSGDSTLVEYNTLVQGRTNTLQYQIYGGSSVYITSSQGYRAIAFDIILPDGMTLTNASVSDTFSTMYSSSTYNSYFNTEKVGGITITNNGNYVEEISGHFGSGINGYRYRLELNDPYTRLYGFYSVKSTVGLLQTCIKLNLDVFVSDVKISQIPYNKVFFAGSTVHSCFNTTAGFSAGDGVTVDDTYGHELKGNAVTIGNGTNYFLYVDTFPFVSVHSANVEIDSEKYYYNASNPDSIGVIDDVGKDASINFSITNAVYFDKDDTGTANKVAYVYFPLPINTKIEDKSDLCSVQDFYVTLNGSDPVTLSYSGGSLTEKTYSEDGYSLTQYETTSGGTVEWRYRNLPKQTNVINMDEAEKDWQDARKDDASNANAIVIKLENFPTDTIDVSISVKGPTIDAADNIVGIIGSSDVTGTDTDMDTGVETETTFGTVYGVGLSGVSVFNTSSSGNTSVYFGGDGPDPSLMSVNSEYIGNNPVYFEFSYKYWDIDYKPLLSYSTIAGSTVVTEFPQVDYSKATPVNQYNKQSITLPNAIEIDGYKFEGWYWDYNLTNEVGDDDPIITEDTTFYASYSQETYSVEYVNDSSTMTYTDRVVSWDRVDLYSEESTAVDGKVFLGWSTVDDAADSIIDRTVSYAKVAGSSSVKTITLYAIYEDTLYTVYYDIAGATPLENVKWTDTNLIPHSVSTNVTGKTFIGWGLSASSLITDSTVFGDIYNDYYNLTGLDNQTVTLIPFYEDSAYTLLFDANGWGIAAPSSVNVSWSTRVLEYTTTPEVEGATFLGWSTSPTSTSCIDMYTTYSMISTSIGQHDGDKDPITLYAQFEWKEYTVIYDFNAITYAYAPEPLTRLDTVKWGELVYDSSLFDFYEYDFYPDNSSGEASGTFPYTAVNDFKIMYRFVGWYADPDFTTEITDIESAVYTKSLVADDEQDTLILYAKYDIVHYSILYVIDENISGNPANGQLSDADYKYLTDNVSFYERGRQNADTIVIPQKVDTSLSSVEFIEKGEKYYDYDNLKFNVPGYELHKWQAENNASLTLTSATFYYHLFGYTDDASLTKANKSDEESATILSQFTPKYYYVSYVIDSSYLKSDDGDAEVLSSVYEEIDQKVVTWQGGDLDIEVSEDIKDGYAFAGWYTTPDPQDGDEPITDVSVLADFFKADNNDKNDLTSDTIADGDTPKLELYAVYTPLVYEVRFDLGYLPGIDDSNVSISSDYLEITGELTLPTVTRVGYSFNGWYTNFDYETVVPSNNKGESWTFESYYKALYSDGSDTEVDVPDGASVTLYAKWSLNITLGITNSDVLFVIEDDSKTGEFTQSYYITNHSQSDIVGLQYISDSDSKWDFSLTEILTDDQLEDDDLPDDQDDLEDEVIDIEQFYLYTMSVLEEYVLENNVSMEEAIEDVVGIEVYAQLIEDLENQGDEEVTVQSRMYVHLTGYQYPIGDTELPDPFFESSFIGDVDSQAIIMYNNTTRADVLFQYEINQDYEDGEFINLFHIDYKFSLD